MLYLANRIKCSKVRSKRQDPVPSSALLKCPKFKILKYCFLSLYPFNYVNLYTLLKFMTSFVYNILYYIEYNLIVM